jgi:hypothetical protein
LETSDKTTIDGCCNDTFTAASGLTTGTQDFNIFGVGPHNVMQGYPLYVGAYASILAGSATGTSWSVQVTGVPTHTQVHWPDQEDNGFGQCSISTTTTTNDTLTCSSPTSVQFDMLQNVGGTTATGSYTLTVTATYAPAKIVHSFTWAYNVGTSSFPSGSPSSQPAIPSLSTWASNMIPHGPTVIIIGISEISTAIHRLTTLAIGASSITTGSGFTTRSDSTPGIPPTGRQEPTTRSPFMMLT